VTISLELWEEILAAAVPSSFDGSLYNSHHDWKADLDRSQVRLQWDPDHGPRGEKLARRAIQLGLRGEILRRYATTALKIEDVTPLVLEGRRRIENGEIATLETPVERVYTPRNAQTAARLGLSGE
jgi:hypothetical protein